MCLQLWYKTCFLNKNLQIFCNYLDLFRAAAEAGPGDILKLYNEKGNIVNISPNLTENAPSSRYRLEVVASQKPGIKLNFIFIYLNL